jgi:hypothetical protein
MRYTNQSFGLRSSISSEPNHFSFSSMASSLPTPSPLAGNERVLPIPSRINPVLAPLHRSADDLSYGGNAMKAVGGHNLVPGHLITGGHSTALNYGSTDSADPYNSGGLVGTISHHQPELYSSSDNWATAAVANDSNVRSHESSSDVYYSHSNDGSRKASQGGQSSISSTLSNGHSYQVPQQQEKPQIPRTSSMDTSRRTAHRRSNASLRAAA